MDELLLCIPAVSNNPRSNCNHVHGGQPPNPRSLTLWANGPDLVLRCRGTKYSMPRPRGRGPFGNARRSGCPPAEPYPADDDQVSFLTRSIPSTSISTRRNPVLNRLPVRF